MKYLLVALFLFGTVQAQMKGDTTKPIFNQIIFLMQQNKELSDRLDRLEDKVDSLARRPYLQLDTKASHAALLVLCPDGSCGIILRKF